MNARATTAAVTAVSIVARLVLLNGGWVCSTSSQVVQAAAGTPQSANTSRKMLVPAPKQRLVRHVVQTATPRAAVPVAAGGLAEPRFPEGASSPALAAFTTNGGRSRCRSFNSR
jgi:hypothetical protein